MSEPSEETGATSEAAPATEDTCSSGESGLQGPEDVRPAATDDEPSGASPGNVGGGHFS